MVRPPLPWRVLPALLALVLPAPLGAVEFAPLFSDGAVLQAGLPVNVWGRAEPGTTVTVSFAGQEKTAAADEEGRWRLQLEPLESSTEPRTLTASGAGSTASIAHVVVGEVWIAAGQSNMVRPLAKSEGGAAALARSLPMIRFVIVPRQAGWPAQPFTPGQLTWRSFDPDDNRALAAVAFHFAEELQREKGGRNRHHPKFRRRHTRGSVDTARRLGKPTGVEIPCGPYHAIPRPEIGGRLAPRGRRL